MDPSVSTGENLDSNKNSPQDFESESNNSCSDALGKALSMMLANVIKDLNFKACSSESPDGSGQHVGVMNATFSAPCSLVPIDSCQVGAHNPVFLQQASYVTGGVYVKSQQVSFVNHRPSISFAPEVAVQHLSNNCTRTGAL
ncbi:hypothetical protein POTOM_014880 [Populus tomentosa]|uniref:General transcription and DNA repair factor IIH subunit TFB4 n=1 Tax=Populus tomentosa TaxID=118781 RepID=A0A8X7ZWM4_POPTO|nr:hypothetical protein POTOM_014880 [Populus tomentosa]